MENVANEIAPQCQAHYTIESRYGGESKRPIMSFEKPVNKGNRQYNNIYNRNFRSRKPRQLRGRKGCIVCHKEGNMANPRHTEEEVKGEIRNLKARQSRALFTGEDLAYVADLFQNDDTDHAYEPEEDDDQYDEGTANEDQRPNLAYIAETDMAETERCILCISLIQPCPFQLCVKAELIVSIQLSNTV